MQLISLNKGCWLALLFFTQMLYSLRAQDEAGGLHQGARDRIEVLLEQSQELIGKKPSEALSLAEQALQLSAQIKDDIAIAKSYSGLSQIYLKQEAHQEAIRQAHLGLPFARRSRNAELEAILLTQLSKNQRFLSELDSAIQYSRESLVVQERAGIRSQKSTNYFEIGVAYDMKGEFDDAVSNLLQALEEAERSSNQAQVALVLNSLGVVNRSAENFDQALEYYHRAQTLYSKLDDPRSLGNVLHNIGDLYLNQGDFENGLTFTEQGKAIREQIKDYYGLAFSYQNLAFVYFYHFKDYQRAFESDSLAYEVRQQIGDQSGMATTLNDMAWDLFSLGQITKAFEKSIQALQMARRLGVRAIERNCLELLAQIATAQGDFKQALEYQNQFYELKDSLFNAEKSKVIQELQLKYETTKKEQLLLEKQTLIERRTNQRNTYFMVAVLAALLTLSLILGFRNRLRYNQQLAAQASELQNQRIRELEQNQKLVALDAMMKGQEKERHRIAKDLHDGLGGLLSSIKHHFRAVSEQNQSLMGLPVFQKTNRMLDEANEEVRRIAHNMMPDALSKLGLVAAVEDLAESYRNNSSLQVSVQSRGWEGRLAAENEIMMFRIIQELLQNIVKHAQANHIFIQFTPYEGYLILTVEDDGKGFNLTEARSNGGMGLKNLESRVAYLDGQMDIETSPGKGTVFIIQIPYNP